jgi:hypothetical protein
MRPSAPTEGFAEVSSPIGDKPARWIRSVNAAASRRRNAVRPGVGFLDSYAGQCTIPCLATFPFFRVGDSVGDSELTSVVWYS